MSCVVGRGSVVVGFGRSLLVTDRSGCIGSRRAATGSPKQNMAGVLRNSL